MRGLYAITPDTHDTDALVARVEAAISGGARFVQYRNKAADESLRLEQARALKSSCAERAALIINDHVDLAAAVDADGVHLGGDDASPAAARRVLGGIKIIGVSCYNRLEHARAAEAQGAQYVAFGSFFPSRVKPSAVHASIALLARARAELTLPIVAIGGITANNAQSLINAGTDAVAVISSLFDAPDIVAAARQFAALFDR